LEELHESIADALGKPLNDPITKLSLDGIVIRNANGMRFMFRKEEPKLEVTFQSTASTCSYAVAFTYCQLLLPLHRPRNNPFQGQRLIQGQRHILVLLTLLHLLSEG
jgi:hypothetical protein